MAEQKDKEAPGNPQRRWEGVGERNGYEKHDPLDDYGTNPKLKSHVENLGLSRNAPLEQTLGFGTSAVVKCSAAANSFKVDVVGGVFWVRA
jgi:hypothetical protein